MKKAIIRLQISAHEVAGNELKNVIPKDVMEANGVPLTTVVSIEGEDDFHLLKKVREWIASAKNL